MPNKRQFYIIGHNPNTIDEALANLKAGANALEPDIHFDMDFDGHFYVYHDNWSYPNSGVPTLKEYLQAIGAALKADSSLNLALIAFDLKPHYNFDINELYSLIRSNFSDEFPGTAILTTVGEFAGGNLLTKVQNNQRTNEAVGIDQSTTAAE